MIINMHQHFSAAPPPPITNLATDSPASDSVTLNWTRPATNCLISQYFVSYSGSVLWKDEKDEGSIRIEGDVTETAVRGLTPYANYTFCVVANNAMGNATEECLQDVVTLQGSEDTSVYMYIHIYIIFIIYTYLFIHEFILNLFYAVDKILLFTYYFINFVTLYEISLLSHP